MNKQCSHMDDTFKFLTLNSEFLLPQLEMEDGDEIDAMLHQTGGAMG